MKIRPVVVEFLRADRRDEADSRFSQCCAKYPKNREKSMASLDTELIYADFHSKPLILTHVPVLGLLPIGYVAISELVSGYWLICMSFREVPVRLG